MAIRLRSHDAGQACRDDVPRSRTEDLPDTP
jgi:hypothetical protein